MADPIVQDWLGGLYSIYNLSGATFQDHMGVLFQVPDGTSIGGNAGAGGRLTLTTLVPVMTSTVASVTTFFYTPYAGDRISIYNGTNWKTFTFTELSNVTTATTVGSAGPLAVANNTNYDMFVWDTSLGATTAGTLALTRGPAWTDGTTRSAGTALVMQNGVLVNSVAITNGPAIKCGRYVGTVRSNGTAGIEWTYGTVAANWGQAIHNVWNMYNRVTVAGQLGDSTDSWPYNAATPRAPNGNATARVSFVIGGTVSEDAISATHSNRPLVGASTVAPTVAVALDSTSTISGLAGFGNSAVASTGFVQGSWNGTPGIGAHYVSAIEICSAAQTITFYGDAGAPTFFQTGMSYLLRM